jgi:hypothetical protein
MDQMVVAEDDDGTGTVACTIESQQAYASQATNSRYSEQGEIDPTDTSQKWVWQLANMTPAIGQAFRLAGGARRPGSLLRGILGAFK